MSPIDARAWPEPSSVSRGSWPEFMFAPARLRGCPADEVASTRSAASLRVGKSVSRGEGCWLSGILGRRSKPRCRTCGIHMIHARGWPVLRDADIRLSAGDVRGCSGSAAWRLVAGLGAESRTGRRRRGITRSCRRCCRAACGVMTMAPGRMSPSRRGRGDRW